MTETFKDIPPDHELSKMQPRVAEAFRRFPDLVERLHESDADFHPAGKIILDQGACRFAFISGWRVCEEQKAQPHSPKKDWRGGRK